MQASTTRFSKVKVKIQSKNNCASLNVAIWEGFESNRQV